MRTIYLARKDGTYWGVYSGEGIPKPSNNGVFEIPELFEVSSPPPNGANDEFGNPTAPTAKWDFKKSEWVE